MTGKHISITLNPPSVMEHRGASQHSSRSAFRLPAGVVALALCVGFAFACAISDVADRTPAPTPTAVASPVQPTPQLTATPPASREETLLAMIIENKPPTITGHGFRQRVDATPDCAEVFYIFGSSISGRPPKFAYAPPSQGLYDVVIRCDEDGNHYFTRDSYIDELWNYLSR